ncbi:MAG: 2-C-methyl-D-erythritol 2,4-cyclodiphosphate synthase [Phycisphaerae bacterium]|nr:2-C-methyl-D-erythritol 2,4-cyclodiphosphate synthase [Phycisphaerae bacterium]
MEEASASHVWPRVGIGWDQHKLVPERPLILCGVQVPYNKGLMGHSDGDMVLHAIIDAMLGAAGLDDIGQQFPDTDPAYAGVDSRELVKRTLELVVEAGYRPIQVDVVIVAEQPKLAGYKVLMRSALAGLLGLGVTDVNVKAKTAERLGEIGRLQAMSCTAVTLLVPLGV